MKTIIHDSCLKRNVRIYVWNVITFLHTWSLNFFHVIFAETWSFSKCHIAKSNKYNWFLFFIYVPNKLYIFSSCTFLFFIWWNMNHSTTLIKTCRRSAGTFTGSFLCVSGVGSVHIKPSVCLRHFSHLLSLLPLSFSEYSHVWYPWQHSIYPFDFDLWCIFE